MARCIITLKDPWRMLTLHTVHESEVVRIKGTASAKVLPQTGKRAKTIADKHTLMTLAVWDVEPEAIMLVGHNQWVAFADGSLQPRELSVPIRNMASIEWLP